MENILKTNYIIATKVDGSIKAYSPSERGGAWFDVVDITPENINKMRSAGILRPKGAFRVPNSIQEFALLKEFDVSVNKVLTSKETIFTYEDGTERRIPSEDYWY